ncbi:MAG: hypothetical protein ACHQE5_03820 [Actinomycetes bacterium]
MITSTVVPAAGPLVDGLSEADGVGVADEAVEAVEDEDDADEAVEAVEAGDPVEAHPESTSPATAARTTAAPSSRRVMSRGSLRAGHRPRAEGPDQGLWTLLGAERGR